MLHTQHALKEHYLHQLLANKTKEHLPIHISYAIQENHFVAIYYVPYLQEPSFLNFLQKHFSKEIESFYKVDARFLDDVRIVVANRLQQKKQVDSQSLYQQFRYVCHKVVDNALLHSLFLQYQVDSRCSLE